jgi:phage terminase large subunit-like protein
MAHKRICSIASRDIGKSFFWAKCVPIWALDYDIVDQVYLFSDTEPQARKHLRELVEMIEAHPDLAKRLIPTTGKTTRSTTEIELTKGRRIFAKGFGSKVRGAHPPLIVCDDILGDEQIYSEGERDKAIDLYYSSISNMASPDSWLITCGTPFHFDDLIFGNIRKNPKYHTMEHPAKHLDANGQEAALWPWRYSLDQLKSKAIEIGAMRFSREYLCQPISSEASLFPEELLVPCYDDKFAMLYSYDGPGKVIIGCDFAFSANRRADYTVFVVLLVDEHENFWLLDIFRKQGMGYQEQLNTIKDLNRRYKPDIINVETNQAQSIYFNELQKDTSIPVRSFVTGRQKNSEEAGVLSLRILFENRKMKLPRRDLHSREMVDLLAGELMNFGWEKGKLAGVGSKDDIVMALWIAKEAYQRGGFDLEFV